VNPTPDLVRLYDATAWYWDSWVHSAVYKRAYIRLFEKLEREGWLGPYEQPVRVLDCGTGTGLLLSSFAEAVRGPCALYGIDTSARMLERAQKNLERWRLPAAFAVASADLLPFGDAEMDLAMAALVLVHLPRPLDALHEMARVTRPGGTVLVVTPRPHAPDGFFRARFHYEPLPPNKVICWLKELGIGELSLQPLSGLARPFAHAIVGRKMP
jgi:ubiquinone/menaquinone biosynthesis C-methylase UbiE